MGRFFLHITPKYKLKLVFRSAMQFGWLKNVELTVNIVSMFEGFALMVLFIIMAAFMYFVARWFMELINNHFGKKNPENDVSFPI